jgi:hypothetical protein
MSEIFLHDIDDQRVHSLLRSKIDGGDVVLFAGAGLSAQATTEDGRHPPLWRDLISGMISWCQQQQLIDPSYAQQIQELVDANLLLDAGQEIEDAILSAASRALLQQGLSEVLLSNSAETSVAHRLITHMGFRGLLTTNYDDLLESAYIRTEGTSVKTFYEETHDGVMEAWRSRQPFILKIHGDVSHPQSIVLGRRSYERLLYANSNYIRTLENLVSVSSILFVGFGGTDPNLEHVLSRASISDGRSKRHWIVVSRAHMPTLVAKRLWKDKGINTIWYQGGHADLVRFLEKLADTDTSRAVEDRPRFTPAAARR